MSSPEPQLVRELRNQTIHSLLRLWKAYSLAEKSLYGLAICLPLLALLSRFSAMSSAWLILTGAGLLAGATLWLARRGHWFSAGEADLAHYLNRKYPNLEDSADLLLRNPDELSQLGKLQQRRVADHLSTLRPGLPHQIPRAFTVLLASAVASAFLLWVPLPESPAPNLLAPNREETRKDSMELGIEVPPQLRELSVRVVPPSYTGIKSSTQSEADIKAPEGSLVEWSLSFSPDIQEGKITVGEGADLPLVAHSTGTYTASMILRRTTFYHPAWRGRDTLWLGSDFHKLEMIPDDPPRIEVSGLPGLVEYVYSPGKTLAFSVAVSDDYGIIDARMVATLSRGEGESVQFRDDTLRFDQSFRQTKKAYTLNYTLDLDDLGMEAGDELYLHIEALDNRPALPGSAGVLAKGGQLTKTSKFIISFENPEATTMDMAGGLGVSRLPEYFRSQRQIIIDTEKLIAQKKELDEKALQQQSNNIAIDQKLLRLRYGRFLGEEFQTVIGAIPEPSPDETEEGHEGEDDHDHAAEGHDEDGAFQSEDGEVAELQPYYHTHDMSAEATFFDASTKAKLQAALSEMWDAELHLRMARPEEALPFEYKALRLIKEIQQASRVYVQRIGFEPPAINQAEKRLSGELAEIAVPGREVSADIAFAFPAIRQASLLLEQLLQQNRWPSPTGKAVLQEAGEELAGLALERPGASYLKGLQWLRGIIDSTDPATREARLRDLQRVFWSILPDPGRQPLRRDDAPSDLYTQFLREIQRSK